MRSTAHTTRPLARTRRSPGRGHRGPVPRDAGPHRKYYGINPQGRAMLDLHRKEWQTFAGTVSALLRTGEVAA